jgi:hypothetical protein
MAKEKLLCRGAHGSFATAPNRRANSPASVLSLRNLELHFAAG